jgi:hypothetical protein
LEGILLPSSYPVVYYLAVSVDRKVEWQRILRQPRYLTVYYLAVGVDRNVDWEGILLP